MSPTPNQHTYDSPSQRIHDYVKDMIYSLRGDIFSGGAMTIDNQAIDLIDGGPLVTQPEDLQLLYDLTEAAIHAAIQATEEYE